MLDPVVCLSYYVVSPGKEKCRANAIDDVSRLRRSTSGLQLRRQIDAGILYERILSHRRNIGIGCAVESCDVPDSRIEPLHAFPPRPSVTRSRALANGLPRRDERVSKLAKPVGRLYVGGPAAVDPAVEPVIDD